MKAEITEPTLFHDIDLGHGCSHFPFLGKRGVGLRGFFRWSTKEGLDMSCSILLIVVRRCAFPGHHAAHLDRPSEPHQLPGRIIDLYGHLLQPLVYDLLRLGPSSWRFLDGKSGETDGPDRSYG